MNPATAEALRNIVIGKKGLIYYMDKAREVQAERIVAAICTRK